MKIAESRPVFEKLDNTSKDNYRPKSTLSIFTNFLRAVFFHDWMVIYKTNS